MLFVLIENERIALIVTKFVTNLIQACLQNGCYFFKFDAVLIEKRQ